MKEVKLFGLEERFNELLENTRRDLKEFEKEQIGKIDIFEKKQIRKIDTKIDGIRRLADAIQEGRLMEVIKGGKLCQTTIGGQE